MIDIIKIGILYDYYENLLTERQRTILVMYLNENLSLAEISEEVGITRQGAHDIISRTSAKLLEYEAKLKLLDKRNTNRKAVRDIIEDIETGRKAEAIEKVRKLVY